jgi:hypothetical protein
LVLRSAANRYQNQASVASDKLHSAQADANAGAVVNLRVFGASLLVYIRSAAITIRRPPTVAQYDFPRLQIFHAFELGWTTRRHSSGCGDGRMQQHDRRCGGQRNAFHRAMLSQRANVRNVSQSGLSVRRPNWVESGH